MVDIDKKLKKQFGDKNAFDVPENYFDEFSAKMMAQIEEEEAKVELPEISAWTRFKPYVYMAASFVALFLIARQVIPTQEPQEQVIAEETNIIVSDDYDVLYSQIDEYSLVEFAIEEDIPSLVATDEE